MVFSLVLLKYGKQCFKGVASIFKRKGPFLLNMLALGWIQITKSCLVSDKYCSEVALKIDTVKDRGVTGRGRGHSEPPGPPLAISLCFLFKLPCHPFKTLHNHTCTHAQKDKHKILKCIFLTT